jgi:hypothetical protein
MSKARTLANLISDNAELADGQISVAEVVGAAPTASPTFTGNIDAGDNVKIRLGDSDDLQIYSNNNNSFITESGSGSLFVNASNLVLRNTSGEYYFYGNSDGAVNLYHNNEPKLATTSTGIDVTGDLSLNDGTPAILLKVSGAEKGYIRSNSDVTEVNGASGSALRQNGFMKLATTSTGIDVTGSVSISDYIKHSGDSDTFFGFSNLNQIYFQAGNSRNLDLGPVSTVFNQDDADIDFRVESDSNDHMLFVDAANNRVGINNSNPANTLDVTGSIIGSVGFSSATPQQTTGTPFGSTVGGGPNSTRTFIVSPPSEKQSSAIKLGGGNTGGNNSSSWISSQYTGAYASDIRLWAPRLGNHTYGDTDATNVFNARESETNFYSQNEGSSGTIFRTLNLNRSTGVIVNPDGVSNLDFRVASGTHANALFVDAGTGGTELSTTQSNVGLFIHNTTHDSIVQIQASGANKNSVIRFADGDDADVGLIDYDHADNSIDITTNALTNGVEISGTKGIHAWKTFENWGTSNYNLTFAPGVVFQRKGNIADDVKIRVFQGGYTYCGGSIEYVIRKDSGYQTIVGSGIIYFNGREGDSGHTIVGSNVSSQIVVNGDTSSGTNADGKFTFNIRGTNGDSHISINNRLGSTVNMALKFNIIFTG